MNDDLAELRREKYVKEIRDLFPDGIERLDVLCRTIAGLLECEGALISLSEGSLVFALGVHGLPFRTVVRDRPRRFLGDMELESRSLTDAQRYEFFSDRHNLFVDYICRVPVFLDGTPVGSLVVFDHRPRLDGLAQQQWEGLRAAAELAEKILNRSSVIKAHLAGLAELIVR